MVFPAFVHQAFGGVSVVAVPLHFEPDDIGAHIRWRACISPAVLVLRVEKALHIVTAQAYDAIVDRGCGLLDAVLYLSGGIAHFNVLALYWPALVGTVSPVGSVTNTPPFFTWQVMVGVTPALNAPVSVAVVFQVGRTPQKIFYCGPVRSPRCTSPSLWLFCWCSTRRSGTGCPGHCPAGFAPWGR